MKPYNFILATPLKINGAYKNIDLTLSGDYHPSESHEVGKFTWDAPTVRWNGMNIDELLALVDVNSIGFMEWLDEEIEKWIYRQECPDKDTQLITDHKNAA